MLPGSLRKGAWRPFIIAGLLCVAFSMSAAASYLPFNTSHSMNIGIGTATPQGAFVVTNGNVGIGTWAPSAALDVETGGNSYLGGNVGISSTAPGAALDVQGMVRTTGFTLSSSPVAGDILMTNGVGIGTWIPASAIASGNTSNYWTLNGGAGNVGISTIYSVGIGTTFAGAGAGLLVMNGNVGIGTWVPAALVDEGGLYTGSAISGATMIHKIGANVNGISGMEMRDINAGNAAEFRFAVSDNNGDDYLAFSMPSTTNISTIFGQTRSGVASIFTNHTTTGRILAIGPYDNEPMIFGTNNIERMRIDNNGNVGIGTTVPNGKLIVSGGNVGIGSLAPGQILDVQGTIRTTGFSLNLNPSSGDVLVGNGIGVGTWMPASTLGASGSGSNYWSLNGGVGNVGINTSYAVGIGTAFVGGTGEAALSVMNGNVGIGTWVPGSALAIQGNLAVTNGTAFNVFTTNVGIGSVSPGASLDVQGMLRTTTFTLNNSPLAGDILMTNGVGVGTWIPASAVAGPAPSNYWSLNGGAGNVGISTMNTVGIGTTSGVGEGLVVMNGSVGIGTWTAHSGVGLTVMNGFVGIGTVGGNAALQIAYNGSNTDAIGFSNVQANGRAWVIGDNVNSPPGPGNFEITDNTVNIDRLVINSSGNVGIGSVSPGQVLDVQGTIRALGETVNGNVGVGTSAIGSTPRTLNINNVALFNSEYNNGSPSSPVTINWANGNKQAVTLTATGMAINFTNPPSGVGAVQLKVIQDGTGARTISTWTPSSGNIFWAGGSPPTLTTTATYLDIVSCYFDGSSYYCATTLNFQ